MRNFPLSKSEPDSCYICINNTWRYKSGNLHARINRRAGLINKPKQWVVNFKPSQVKWAQKHDWFISASQHTIVVRDNYTTNGQLHSKIQKFTNFDKLYIWAGY